MKINPQLAQKISAARQEHLLRRWNYLDEAQQQKLAGQLEAVDFDRLPGWINDYVLRKPETAIPADLGPAPFFPMTPGTPELKALYQRADARGEELLRAGRVCCLTVAGGQGTRLGFNGPKGTFPIGPVSGKPLFAFFAEGIRAAEQRYGCKIDWYIMTSQLNHEATTQFFAEHEFFGLDSEQVFFFTQGTMPAVGYDGKLLLNAPDSLALSPDGHGGTLLALRRSGALERMSSKGYDIISYFQVDNPLVPVVDPRFIGLHDLERSQMSAVMLAKTGPMEKLGNFCVSGGRLQIIEYSDLPVELAEKRKADGTLEFLAGSPAIHLLDRSFVEKLTAGDSLRLPWHRADKKIPFIDANGVLQTPAAPNGVKLESFIFDALPLAERTMILECDRSEVFSPTKNPTGVDSVESCRAMLIERDARRLEAAGVSVPRTADGKPDAEVELTPLAGFDRKSISEYLAAKGITAISRGERIYLD